MAHLLRLPLPLGAGRYGVGGERTDQPVHPPPNATSPLKRGTDPGLLMDSGTCVSWWLSQGGGEKNGPLQVTPLAFSPGPREESAATVLIWAGWWEWPFH